MEEQGIFVLFNKVKLEDLKIGDKFPESDFMQFHNGIMYQFKWVEKEPNLKVVK